MKGMTRSSVSSVRDDPAVDSGYPNWVDFSEENDCDDAVISHAVLPAITEATANEACWQTQWVAIPVTPNRGHSKLS
jgi:hypothetical protein